MTVEELNREIEDQVLLGNELEEFAGQWVAAIGSKVVAHGQDLEALVDSLTEQQADEATIFRVPEERTVACFY